MDINFYITPNRLDELKTFVRKNLKSAYFNHNPLKEGHEWFISLHMEVEDANKLSELRAEWYYQDNPKEKQNA